LYFNKYTNTNIYIYINALIREICSLVGRYIFSYSLYIWLIGSFLTTYDLWFYCRTGFMGIEIITHEIFCILIADSVQILWPQSDSRLKHLNILVVLSNIINKQGQTMLKRFECKSDYGLFIFIRRRKTFAHLMLYNSDIVLRICTIFIYLNYWLKHKTVWKIRLRYSFMNISSFINKWRYNKAIWTLTKNNDDNIFIIFIYVFMIRVIKIHTKLCADT